MYQYYVLEIQTYADGTYGNIRHFVYDEDEKAAKLKGESKYHEVLAAAAISELPRHGAILVTSKCEPLLYECYDHTDSTERVFVEGMALPAEQNLYQYYIFEAQKYVNGEYGDLTHFAYDANPHEARLKGESKYYEVLSAAAVSKLLQHGALLLTSTCIPIYHKCYEYTPAETA